MPDIHSDILHYFATPGRLASAMSIKVISIFKMSKKVTHLWNEKGTTKVQIKQRKLLHYTLRKYEIAQEK